MTHTIKTKQKENGVKYYKNSTIIKGRGVVKIVLSDITPILKTSMVHFSSYTIPLIIISKLALVVSSHQ